MRITQLETQLLRLPLERPINALGRDDRGRVPIPTTASAGVRLDHLFMLVVHVDTDAGHRGLGFAYSLHGGGRALKVLVDDDLAPLLIGEDPLDHERLAAKVYWRLQTIGRRVWWPRRTRLSICAVGREGQGGRPTFVQTPRRRPHLGAGLHRRHGLAVDEPEGNHQGDEAAAGARHDGPEGTCRRQPGGGRRTTHRDPRPDLLMLDEPFGALDAFTREELWCVLQDLWTRRRFTTILVTHDLREATFLADVIHVMSVRPGHMVASHEVNLPRPRTIEMTFAPVFNEIVHGVRGEISDERRRAGARGVDPGRAIR